MENQERIDELQREIAELRDALKREKEIKMKNDERLNWAEELWEGATKVASSRSGVTENYRLTDGTLVEVYHFKSGRIACQAVSTINDSLTVRPHEIIQPDDPQLKSLNALESTQLRMRFLWCGKCDHEAWQCPDCSAAFIARGIKRPAIS